MLSVIMTFGRREGGRGGREGGRGGREGGRGGREGGKGFRYMTLSRDSD